jgi:hypothetical protein
MASADVGPKTKSSYFVAILCYYYAEKAGYRLPDAILSENFTYEECKDSTVFFLDDMSYSGSQIKQLLHKIYVHAARENPAHVNKRRPVNMNKIEALPVDIRTGLCVITERARNELKTFRFNASNMGRAYAKNRVPNPYPIYAAEVIPDLEKLVGAQQYTDCLIYFNPFRDSSCMCYFDHKLADGNSTFLNVLRFGVVPPTNINYRFIYGHEARGWSKYRPYYNQTEEECDKEIQQTKFIPFLKGCSTIDPAFREKLEALPYHIFMMSSAGPDEDGVNMEYGFYDINISKNTDLYEYKNSVELRCPHSWYKNHYFTGGGKTKRRRRKSR